MQILIASDGSAHARQAALFARLLAWPAEADITLLGVVENGRREDDVRRALAALEQELSRTPGDVQIKVGHGYADELIVAEVERHFYHLVVVGSRGRRRLKRFLLGSTAKHLARHINTALLIVTHPRPAINRIVVCTSGGEPGEADAAVGGALAALVDAEVTVLHVMSQIPLAPDAPVEDLTSDTQTLIERGAREGRHLEREMEILRTQGVNPERYYAKVRYGLVIDEILGEIREGDYDLVVIGAHQVPRDQPWADLRRVLQLDVADEILTNIHRPVLVVRAIHDLELPPVEGRSEPDH